MSDYDPIAELFMKLGRLEQRIDWLEGNPAKPEQSDNSPVLESSGNVVCLPGVTLERVKRRSRRRGKGVRS